MAHLDLAVNNRGKKLRNATGYSVLNNIKTMFIPIMCGYMHGHYHIHLRVRELAVTPSPVNHMALGDHLFLSLVLCEPHKAKTFRISSLGVSFYLENKTMIINYHCVQTKANVYCVNVTNKCYT